MGPRYTWLPEDDELYSLVHDKDQELVTEPVVSKRSSSQWGNLWWVFEAIAAIVGLATFWILIVVLQYYDGQLQKPRKFGVTPNAVIAGLSSVIRTSIGVCITAALSQSAWHQFSKLKREEVGQAKILDDFEIFDDASRGSWGSVKLLWRFKAVQHMACLGAALTILSLVFEPLTQQLLTVEYQRVLNGTTADYVGKVPRIRIYETFNPGKIRGARTISLPMAAAVSSGILSNTAVDMPMFCATENCTWPITPTVAVCGECTDITKTLVTTLKTTFPTGNLEGQNLTEYRLPSGTSIAGASRAQRQGQCGGNTTCITTNGNLPIFFSAVTPGTVYKSNGSRAIIANIDLIGSPYESGSATFGALDAVIAHECALWWCLASYNISVHNGKQSITTDTWSETKFGDWWYNFTNIPSSFNVLPGDSYGVSYDAHLGLAELPYSFFGTISDTETGGEYVWTPNLQAIWQYSSNPNPYFQKIALGMSNSVRVEPPQTANYITLKAAEDDSPSYNGQAYYTPAFIRARLEWLLFPAVMLHLLSGSLFISTRQNLRAQRARLEEQSVGVAVSG